MDYCSAGSVRDMIEVCEAALTEEQVAFVCKEALMGLLYLHARKIIHRYIFRRKPNTHSPNLSLSFSLPLSLCAGM